MSGRTNAQWLAALNAPGPERDTALADLRAILVAGLPHALNQWLAPDDPHLSALAEEVAQETLLRVLAHLDSFEGRSQFTTWAHKIAVRLALTELRRHKWREISLDDLLEAETPASPVRLMADPRSTPEQHAEQADLSALLQRMIMEELTAKQRQAMLAMGQGMPLSEIAQRLGMERNALYKLLHDGRMRLKRRLEREGLLSSEMLAVFERG